VGVLRFIGNVVWLLLGGIWLALLYLLAALLMAILIVTFPFAIAAGRMALFAVWPFGRTVVKRPEAGAPSLIGNILWLVLCGWWLTIGHIVTAVAQALTIVGIPVALANLKLIPVSLWPFGREIVSVEEARELQARGEIEQLAVVDRGGAADDLER
jgi:uncharacterized membrane protein YccF (DUF307 family)